MAENDNLDLEAKIKKNKEKYGDLVKRLYERDEAAWNDIKLVVKKAWDCRSPNGHTVGKIAKDINVTQPEEFFAELYCLMIEKRKLDLYRYEADLYNWMIYNYVIKEILLKKCPRTQRFTDKQTGAKSNKRIVVSKDPKLLEDTTVSAPDPQEDETVTDEEIQLLEEAVTKLHRQNPLEAYLLLLHGQEGLTFHVICDVLGEPDNKDNREHYQYVFRRAIENMKEIMH